jgi:hypothetical protein
MRFVPCIIFLKLATTGIATISGRPTQETQETYRMDGGSVDGIGSTHDLIKNYS